MPTETAPEPDLVSDGFTNHVARAPLCQNALPNGFWSPGIALVHVGNVQPAHPALSSRPEVPCRYFGSLGRPVASDLPCLPDDYAEGVTLDDLTPGVEMTLRAAAP